jgi:hypothetical protein
VDENLHTSGATHSYYASFGKARGSSLPTKVIVQRVDNIPSFASSPIPQMPPGTLFFFSIIIGIHSPDERVTPSTRLRMALGPGASCMSAGGFARRSNSGSPCGTPIDTRKASTQSSAPYFPPPGTPPASHGMGSGMLPLAAPQHTPSPPNGSTFGTSPARKTGFFLHHPSSGGPLGTRRKCTPPLSLSTYPCRHWTFRFPPKHCFEVVSLQQGLLIAFHFSANRREYLHRLAESARLLLCQRCADYPPRPELFSRLHQPPPTLRNRNSR